jgi:hypothetical protein
MVEVSCAFEAGVLLQQHRTYVVIIDPGDQHMFAHRRNIGDDCLQ